MPSLEPTLAHPFLLLSRGDAIALAPLGMTYTYASAKMRSFETDMACKRIVGNICVLGKKLRY